MFSDWQDRYEHLIELGKELPPIPPERKIPANLVQGCQSQVWLDAELKDGRVRYTADSDAVITKGIAALLVRVFSGHEPQEIIGASMDFIDRIGLRAHLSPHRANGLSAMIDQMKRYALALSSKTGKP